ncbi:MAG: Holliday junction resolvase RuvX [Acidimicrobiia bacterium]
MLGVDLGTRRIGVALSDPLGTVASPLQTLERSGDPAQDHRTIVEIAREHDAARIVVGLPRSMSGALGPAARAALDEVEALRVAAGPALPVDTVDERLTSVIANRSLAEANVRGAKRRGTVDRVAAAVILQSYLDAHRA